MFEDSKLSAKLSHSKDDIRIIGSYDSDLIPVQLDRLVGLGNSQRLR